ncbi:ThuA domain-containing protein [Sphingomonas sp. DT-204]|uniref:ThuA domain-containing protein n=1 Tax=Sphingomonas sp. DT-204 TaxID=3396166 RepID=UPI003F1B8E4B
MAIGKLAMLLAGLMVVGAAQQPRDPHLPAPVVDSVPPELPRGLRDGVLILSKTNGWRHLEHLPHSNAVLSELAAAARRRSYATENAAVLNDAQLARFSVVVLNSVSGDFAMPAQQAALQRWIEAGGGVVALHAAGDGSHAWPWWIDEVIGARFTGHPGGADHIQRASISVLAPGHPVMAGVRLPWTPNDEWYSFDRVPGGAGLTLLATIDEGSYRPPQGKAMGKLHPVIWARQVGRGRVVYAALGHMPEAYDDPNFRRIIANALRWVAKR